MDDGRMGDEMTLQAIANRLDEIGAKLSSLDEKVASLDSKVSSLNGKVSSLDGKVDSLDHKMKIEFEETRRVVKLGFESTEMLRDEVGRRFDETDRAHADHKTLLEAALVGVRRDMKRG